MLAGGTWLFSEQQPRVHRLVDLLPLGWQAIGATDAGLTLGATCTISELYQFDAPGDWRAGSLLKTSCEAFLASFKVWNSATLPLSPERIYSRLGARRAVPVT